MSVTLIWTLTLLAICLSCSSGAFVFTRRELVVSSILLARNNNSTRSSLQMRLVDRVLAPVRDQIVEVVSEEPKIKLLDVACGTGDQLLRLEGKVADGSFLLGIDLNADSIAYAEERLKATEYMGNTQIEYRVQTLPLPDDVEFDICMTTLFFHVLPWDEAVYLLRQMGKMAPTVIVGAFVPAKNWKDRLLLWIDQRFTSHYSHFQSYLEKRALEGLVSECQDLLEVERVVETNDATIRIYVLRRKNQ